MCCVLCVGRQSTRPADRRYPSGWDAQIRRGATLGSTISTGISTISQQMAGLRTDRLERGRQAPVRGAEQNAAAARREKEAGGADGEAQRSD